MPDLPLPRLVGQKICPNCRTACNQFMLKTDQYTEWQLFCLACYNFERIRIPDQKAEYQIVQPISMASYFSTPIVKELETMQQQTQEAMKERYGDIEVGDPF